MIGTSMLHLPVGIRNKGEGLDFLLRSMFYQLGSSGTGKLCSKNADNKGFTIEQ